MTKAASSTADPILELVVENELGALERRLPLRGKIKSSEATFELAELCVTSRGLWLLARTSKAALVLDVLAQADLRYQEGRRGDRIVLGETSIEVPANKREAVKAAISVTRLRAKASASAKHEASMPAGTRHIEQASLAERELISGTLEQDEVLLGWLHGATELPVYSTLSPNTTGEVRLLLTDRRSLLFALSDLGDVRETSLEEPILAERGFTHTKLSSKGVTWRSRRTNHRQFAELAAITAWSGAERLRECARLNFVAQQSSSIAFARELLKLAVDRGDALARFATLVLRIELGEALPSESELGLVISELSQTRIQGLALAEVWQAWNLKHETGLRMVESLRAFGMDAEPWALELHARVHASLQRLPKGRSERARMDIALAEHLIIAQEHERARELLAFRLSEMPSEALENLLPPSDADLTAGAGGQALRIRVYELLAEAQGGPEGLDVRLVAELARLQPLVLHRIRELVEHAGGELRLRAEAALRVLEPGGLALRERHEPPAEITPLPASSVREVLQHPLVREGGALVGRLQALLASVPIPDHGVLRDYCEGFSSGSHDAAAHALQDAARALGVPAVEGYISRGAKAVGLRAYDSSPPFVLIGGKHLEGEASYRMSDAELRFAVGSEIAHLRYGHSRVTSSEVWAGAISKSRQGLDLALGVLPALRGFKFAERLNRLAAKIPADALRRVLTSAANMNEQLQQGADAPASLANDAVLSRINEELVAAHRVMQLTADRAGLLLAADIAASLRAMLLVRSDYRDLIQSIELSGFDAVLARRTPDGRMAHQDLAVRVAALLAFYLSDEYAKLHAELYVSKPAP